MLSWPSTVLDDLDRKLVAVHCYENRPTPQDVWGEVLDWLAAQGPADLQEIGQASQRGVSMAGQKERIMVFPCT